MKSAEYYIDPSVLFYEILQLIDKNEYRSVYEIILSDKKHEIGFIFSIGNDYKMQLITNPKEINKINKLLTFQ